MVAHWAAAISGVVSGAYYFASAMQVFFRGPSDPRDLIFWAVDVLALPSLLPLGVLGIFKRRIAAFGIFDMSTV